MTLNKKNKIILRDLIYLRSLKIIAFFNIYFKYTSKKKNDII